MWVLPQQIQLGGPQKQLHGQDAIIHFWIGQKNQTNILDIEHWHEPWNRNCRIPKTGYLRHVFWP